MNRLVQRWLLATAFFNLFTSLLHLIGFGSQND